MKNYFLIVLGNFEDEKIVEEITVALTPIVDSPTLKFTHTTGSIVYHFSSDVFQSEIYDYVLVTITDKCNSFFLTESSDKLSVYIPSTVKEHLLDLENDSLNTEIKMKKNLDEELDEEIVALLLDGIRSFKKKPSLDELLEKILSDGLTALSEYEKEVLENYSKN